MRRSIVLATILFFQISYSLFAQTLPIVGSEGGFNEELLQLRVKQIDEFMGRFNFETDWKGKKIATPNDTVLHKKYVLSLFDQNILSDTLTSSIAYDFASQIVSQKQKISYTDKDWYAEAVCKISYNGKEHNLSLFLNTEQIEGHKYKWVFCGAKSNFMNIASVKTEKHPIISPVENEINFMALETIFDKDASNIANYASKDFSADYLSVFLFLVKNKYIKFIGVEDIQYHFFQIPGYVFTVDFFERNDANMGWLISNFFPCDEDKKSLYRAAKFNQ